MVAKQNQSNKLPPVNYESLIQTQDAVSASLMKGGHGNPEILLLVLKRSECLVALFGKLKS